MCNQCQRSLGGLFIGTGTDIIAIFSSIAARVYNADRFVDCRWKSSSMNESFAIKHSKNNL